MLRNAPRHARIAVNSDVMGGKPCIKGTRIPVDLIVEKLDHGQSSEEILKACPDLTLEDVRAAEIYARVVPQSLLDAVIAHFDPLQVILFGSRARGEASVDSDVDLLVVLDDDAPAAKLGWRSAFEARKHFHQAVDMCPVGGAGSRTSVRWSARSPTWPPRTASWSMSGVDPARQRDEAKAWLAQADERS